MKRFAPGERVDRKDVPELDLDDWRAAVLVSGARLAALFGTREDSGVRLWAILAHDRDGRLEAATTSVEDAYPSLTVDLPQAHLFERELAEEFGLRPEGHPWLKPVRLAGASAARYFSVSGREVHEVAVGPVHAGVIEPGHFRFQCHGERVLHLEIQLGYQHRGIERTLAGGPGKRTVHHMETLAGDTSIGHATAYAMIVEGLSRTRVSARAKAIRAIALELERLANHTGDLGALAADAGYLPTAAFCGRLRGDFLNLSGLLCGSRFGRGLVRPGGIGFDVDPAMAIEMTKRLRAATSDVRRAADLLWNTPTVLARFEQTGTVTREVAEELGLVGPAARASGIERDVRHDFPSGFYRFSQIPIARMDTGDVFARAMVRALEIERASTFIEDVLANLPSGEAATDAGGLAPDSVAVSMVEGWRGEVCHVAITDAAGRFARYKVVDPSFRNWMGLAMALRDGQISDFPLCNKSFNLSYCGFDQ